jgi:hypothetical protein
VEANLSHAAPSPELVANLRRALSEQASAGEREAFGRAWQARVAAMFRWKADADQA